MSAVESNVMRPNIYEELRMRIATVDDLKEVMGLAIAAAKENALFDTTSGHLVQIIWPCLNQDKGLIGLIGREGGPIEGMVVLVIGTLGYSDTLCCEEKVVFVPEQYRAAKGGRAHKLLQFSKAAAEKLGLPLLIGVLSNAATKQKVAMYKREFGEPAGAFWVVGAKTGESQVAS